MGSNGAKKICTCLHVLMSKRGIEVHNADNVKAACGKAAQYDKVLRFVVWKLASQLASSTKLLPMSQMLHLKKS
jgi:hypothetical protein